MAAGDDTKGADMDALASPRRQVYAFLSSAFVEPPSEERLSAIRNDAFLNSAAALFDEKTLAPLHRYAAVVGRTADLQRQAQREFMNLFKVPGGRYVTPYESVFCDSREIAGQPVTGLLMGQSAVDVQKWYRLAALEISDEFKDLPDHIGLELHYLAHLCGKEQEFIAAGGDMKLRRAREMQRDFLAAHVVSWIGALRDKIHEESRHEYFRAVADLAVEFTRRDLATLEGLLGPSSGTLTPFYSELGT